MLKKCKDLLNKSLILAKNSYKKGCVLFLLSRGIHSLGRARVGAQSGLGPGPGWGPYGPIWALMLVFKSEAFRVQTAPFEKIRIDLWRSPDTSTHLRPSGSQKTKA